MGELPLGYRFYPTEEELVSFYLRNQLEGLRQDMHGAVPVLDVYDIDPWQLPSMLDPLWSFLIYCFARRMAGGPLFFLFFFLLNLFYGACSFRFSP